MLEITWFSGLLWWAAIFFGGIVAFAMVSRHPGRWTLLGLYVVMLVLIGIAAALGALDGLL